MSLLWERLGTLNASVLFLFNFKVSLKEKTIIEMNAKYQESFAKHEENLRVIQNLEDNIQDLKNDNAVLNRKVSEWKLSTLMYGKC